MKNFTYLALCFSFTVNASSLTPFYEGLKEIFYLERTERGTDLERHVRVTKFSKLGQIFSPDATATYNDKINTISLAEDLLVKKDRKYHIQDPKKIMGNNLAGFPKVSTIFHELGHAEVDVFIENEKTLTDLALYRFYETRLKPLYKKYFKGLSPLVIFHEHFSYYRTELIDAVSMDMMDVFMWNGWNPNTNKCYLSPVLKKKLNDGASLDEFLEIFALQEKSYRDVAPQYIFVKGKDLNLGSIQGADLQTLKEAHLLFWGYHLEFYGFQMNLGKLVQKMNADKRYDPLRECRVNLFYQHSP